MPYAAAAALVLSCLALLPLECLGAEVQAIRSPDPLLEGHSRLEFPAGTTLSDLPFLEMRSYEGDWQAGLAHGEGVIRFRDTMAMEYAGVLGQVDAVAKPNFYRGRFEHGRPVGEGEFVANEMSVQQRTTGMFAGDGVTMSINGQLRAVLTLTPGQPHLGIVRLMQYPWADTRLPTRMFLGRVLPGGAVEGDWVDVPWFQHDEEGSFVGYGRFTEAFGKDGSSVSCTYETPPPDRPELVAELIGSKGQQAQYTAGFDLRLRGKADCVATSPDGWEFDAKVDFANVFEPKIEYVACRTPSGKKGKLKGDRCTYKKKKRNHDFFTNAWREIQRFVDRRVLGTIDRIGGSIEKSMCRATGTEPGKNCNVSVGVGATWPVGDAPANHLPAAEEAARQAFLAQGRRADGIRAAYDDAIVGEAAGLSAGLNALCTAFCATEPQRRYSADLLAQLERAAAQPLDEAGVRSIASINRETASVLSVGVRLAVIGTAAAGPVISFNRFLSSARQQDRMWLALQAVDDWKGSGDVFANELRRQRAIAALEALNTSHLLKMVAEGTDVLGQGIVSNIKVLAGLPPDRVRMLTAAITMGRTREQVRAFVEQHKDIASEEALYDEIIAEILDPLGIEWPPAEGSPPQS